MKKHQVEQNSAEWFHIRRGKVTGSTLKSIMGTPKARQEAIYEIIAERLTMGQNDENTGYENPMERGHRLEPEAIAMFELETGIKTEKVGFITHDDEPNSGNSPDRMVASDDTQAVEVKCPLGKNYVKYWLTNTIPDEYEWQIVQYFICNEQLQKLHFVIYHPDIAIHQLHIIEVTRAELADKIITAGEKQSQFLAEVDEILGTIIIM